MIYTSVQRKLYRSLRPLTLEKFIERYHAAYGTVMKINGSALFFVRDVNHIPPYILHTMFTNDIIYKDNIMVSIARSEEPFGVKGVFKDELAPGLKTFEIQMGYMEVVEVERLLRKFNIDEKTVFYGLEDIVTTNILWKIFSAIKRLAPSFIQSHKLPSHKLHGVVSWVVM